MRIAMYHYHLRPGGVTQVINLTSAALTDLGVAHVILTGDTVQGLGYGGDGDPDALVDRLRGAAKAALGQDPDAWIFHNPTLGKNRDIPGVVARFAADGEVILLHIHDLAEDGRPENFANIPDPARLHLTAPLVHHAFINTRDRARFIDAGLPPDRAHLLPNPIAVDQHGGHPVRRPSNDALVFCPVRGIRRKNLGELCLFAALSPKGTRFAISRAPQNPDEIATHDLWRNFATAHDLPVWFDATERLAPFAGHQSDFESWADVSTHWISTSVVEGFGRTLAEAAARRKPLIARALAAGFTPSETRGIYHHIRVDQAGADFATLDEAAQADVIRRVIASPEFAASIKIDDRPASEWLRERLEDRQSPEPDSQLDQHAPQNVASALVGILRSLVDQPAAEAGPEHRPTWQEPPASVSSLSTAAPAFLPQSNIAALYSDSPPLLAHPRPAARTAFPRAVIFDVYGTLLDAPPGGVRPDPAIDPAIINFLENNHIDPPAAPTAALSELVRREHAASCEAFPEIDLVALWAELLGLPADGRTATRVAEIEDLWHPAKPMPGAIAMLRRLAAADIPCGLLSNAQANVWRQLGELAPCFASDLCVFSHQYLRAKPSPNLFTEMESRLARRGIAPHDVWFVGNDPSNDIAPAKAAGFRTAIFGHATSVPADLALMCWSEFPPGG